MLSNTDLNKCILEFWLKKKTFCVCTDFIYFSNFKKSPPKMGAKTSVVFQRFLLASSGLTSAVKLLPLHQWAEGFWHTSVTWGSLHRHTGAVKPGLCVHSCVAFQRGSEFYIREIYFTFICMWSSSQNKDYLWGGGVEFDPT